MSIDENLNKYRQSLSILQAIIDSGVQNKSELIKEIQSDLKDKKVKQTLSNPNVCPIYNQLVSDCNKKIKCDNECGQLENM